MGWFNQMVNYVCLDAQWKEEKSDLLPIIEKVLASGNYIGGNLIEEFEINAAEACGVQHCIALNSGTDALVCSMHALGIRRGDEVITPPNSFVASTSSIVHLGAVPVFIDVMDDQSLDVSQIEKLITPKTKAIMPVHLTGRMSRMDEIVRLAKEHGLFVIEDSAQSIGSKFKNKLSGSWGHVGCFSTHPLKNLNACGDGGFVSTNDTEIATKIKLMRNHGMVDRNTIENFGFVSRLDTLQAAILQYRLKKLSQVIEKRRQNAQAYMQTLNKEKVFWPKLSEEYFDTYHTFVIQVDRRDELISFLDKRGIQTAIHYPIPIHLQPASTYLGYKFGDFPTTESQANRILTLPINQFLNLGDIHFVADSVNEFVERNQVL